MITRLRRAVDRGLESSLLVLMTVMVVNVAWQVFTRFVLRAPSPYTEELARFLLIWTGLLGGCLAWRRKMHLAIRLFGGSAESPPVWQRRTTLVVTAVFSLLLLVYGGLRLVFLVLELEQRSAALGVPLGYVYLAVPVSGLVLLFYASSELLFGDDPGAEPEPGVS